MSETCATTIDQPPKLSPLKALRKERKLTQKAVACGVPCAPNLITDTEKYNYRPTAELQARIAQFFGVDPLVIWPETDE